MSQNLADAVDSAVLARSIAEAQLEACLSALAAVMQTLANSAGSPSEQKIYANARAVLAEHGRDPQREWRDRACEQWAAREVKP